MVGNVSKLGRVVLKDRKSVETWVKATKYVGLDGDVVVLQAATDRVGKALLVLLGDWLADFLAGELNQRVKVEFLSQDYIEEKGPYYTDLTEKHLEPELTPSIQRFVQSRLERLGLLEQPERLSVKRYLTPNSFITSLPVLLWLGITLGLVMIALGAAVIQIGEASVAIQGRVVGTAGLVVCVISGIANLVDRMRKSRQSG